MSNRFTSRWHQILLIFALLMLSLALMVSGCYDDDDDVERSRSATEIKKKTNSTQHIDGVSAAPQADYYLWQTTQWFYLEKQEVTPDLCQDWTDFWQSGNAFIAIRAPISATITYQTSYSPTLKLVNRSWPPKTFTTIPMESQPERVAYMEQAMPTGQDEHWLAISGATSPPIHCSLTSNLSGGEWDFQLDIFYDFGGAQGAGEGANLVHYYCYEGQDPPFFFPQSSQASGEGRVIRSSLEGDAITCIGPDPFSLSSDFPSWGLEGRLTDTVDASQPITLSYLLYNYEFTTLSVDVTYTSTLGTIWGIYEGTEQGPKIPLTKITSPIRVASMQEYYLWLIADIPSDTPAGPYYLSVTASLTSPPEMTSQSATATTAIWVGQWTAPQPSKRYIYMPLVRRTSP
ncbi:MAG: hypothetical protein GXP39_01800 [Chloroflexi bacterium]|nr:hypothetical protein [Chloroflexota bacterium]